MSPIRGITAAAAASPWGIGDFLLVELVFVLASFGLSVLLIHYQRPTALMLALAVRAPSLIAA